MKRLVAVCFVISCGGETPPSETPKTEMEASLDMPPVTVTDDAGAPIETSPQEKRDKVCTGFELDLAAALNQAACEVPLDPQAKPADVKGKLDIKVVPSAPSVAPGGKLDLSVTFTNKTAAPMNLDFIVDPTARFSVEAFDAKGAKRVDMPWGNPPPPPKGAKRPEAAKASIARVTIAPNGTAKINVPWEAVTTRWAPEKYNGTPPEMGFPRVPAGKLGKGKYKLRIVTPLTNVFEGTDKEISAPKIDIGVQ